MHASGVHATVAGVAAGLLTRVKPDPGETESPGERAEHVIRPISAGVAVPLFAFFAAGVDLRGSDLVNAITTPVAIGVMVGLVVGKPIGVVGTAWLMARFTKASLSSSIRWRDVMAVGLLAGIGFTVSLLIAELAFPYDESRLRQRQTRGPGGIASSPRSSPLAAAHPQPLLRRSARRGGPRRRR